MPAIVNIQIFEWRKEANNFDKEEEKGRVEEDNGGGKYNSILIANFGYKSLCIQFSVSLLPSESVSLGCIWELGERKLFLREWL